VIDSDPEETLQSGETWRISWDDLLSKMLETPTDRKHGEMGGAKESKVLLVYWIAYSWPTISQPRPSKLEFSRQVIHENQSINNSQFQLNTKKPYYFKFNHFNSYQPGFHVKFISPAQLDIKLS
jgi:hypothetical protein